MENVIKPAHQNEQDKAVFITLFTELAGFPPEQAETSTEGLLFLPLDARPTEKEYEKKCRIKDIVGKYEWKPRMDNDEYLGIWIVPPALWGKVIANGKVKDVEEGEVIRIITATKQTL